MTQLQLGPDFAGEWLESDAERIAYATDASPYYRLPQGIACPRSARDCVALMHAAAAHGWTLTPRGAGTSLAGQAIGTGVIVDTSRHMHGIQTVDFEHGWADVEPGLVLDALNRHVRASGLQFAPDPSTYNRCTFGGVIGNNAWGAHAPRDGTTRDHVIEIDAVLADGELLHAEPLHAEALAAVLARNDRTAQIHDAVIAEIRAHRDVIMQRYPDPARVPCNTGYALHVLARMQPFDPHGPPFNLAALWCGSEGTLGLMTRARVRLTRRPAVQVVVAAHFRTLDEAVRMVEMARAQGATAVELLDQVILDLTADNLLQRKHRHWIVDQPRAVVLIEFAGDDPTSVDAQAHAFATSLRENAGAYAAPVLHGAAVDDAWALRRAGLGLLMGLPGTEKPVTLVEDSAVDIPHLPAFVHDVQQLMNRLGKRCVYYGSIGLGLVHLRPLLDLSRLEDRNLMDVILSEVAALLQRYGGALSAKHGDGRLRGPYLRAMLGDELASVTERIKRIFDPIARMNPDVILTASPVTMGLRSAVPRAEPSSATEIARFAIDAATQVTAQCHGAGVCRRPEGEGTMCPSYRATRNEIATTRARANVLREMVVRQNFRGIASNEVHTALDLCLSCKACRRECPANVDMARAKIAHLEAYQGAHGVPLRTRVFAYLDWFGKTVSRMPAWARRDTIAMRWAKQALGVHVRRAIPQPAPERFSAWFARQPASTTTVKPRVVLLNDPLTEYFDVPVGQAAVQVLRAGGWPTLLSPCGGSIRAALSQGLVALARRRLQAQARWLAGVLREGDVVVGLEPSELLLWRDEATDLANNAAERQQYQAIAARALLFEEFLAQYGAGFRATLRSTESRNIWLHVHCHQKALSDADAVAFWLRGVSGLTVTPIASGCCGMAGAFGYEAEHYEVSMAVANLVLLPTLQRATKNDWIVATGASCRQQIRDGAARPALHVAELIATCLPSSRPATSV